MPQWTLKMKTTILILIGVGVAMLLSSTIRLARITQSIAETVATNDPSVTTLSQVVEITSAPKRVKVEFRVQPRLGQAPK